MTRLAHIPPHLRSQIPTGQARKQKYNSVRTYSKLCDKTFDSRAECIYGESLRMRELAGEISDLQYQVGYELCDKPRVSIRLDFIYRLPDRTDLPARAHPEQKQVWIYEDVKGKLTEGARIKLAWLYKQYGIRVNLVSAKEIQRWKLQPTTTTTNQG